MLFTSQMQQQLTQSLFPHLLLIPLLTVVYFRHFSLMHTLLLGMGTSLRPPYV